MMYRTPIQAAAFRSALMPGFPVAAATVRFVRMLFSPVVGAGQTGLVQVAEIGPASFRCGDRGSRDLEVRCVDPYSGRGERMTIAVSRERRAA